MNLADKISELFEYRGFPRLIAAGKMRSDKRQILNDKLIKLQTEIYGLDAILESNWVLDDEQMALAWKQILAALHEFPLKKSEYDYLKTLRRYEHHEKKLREGVFGLHMTMEYFYFFKSCDVKLLRRLIYEQIPELQRDIKLSDWREFDLITEVNDDVADMIEDMETINGNRFLISYLVNGPEITRNDFREFIIQIAERRISKTLHKDDTPIRVFADETMERELNYTLHLIDAQLDLIESMDKKNIRLAEYCKELAIKS